MSSRSGLTLSVSTMVIVLCFSNKIGALLQRPDSNPAASSGNLESQRDPAANSPDIRAQPDETQNFSGKISKSGEKYVLTDRAGKTAYLLDDQKKAKQFDGQPVKVRGVLNPQTNVIHIASIEPGV